jgi:thymidylate synthase (FAD)
MNVKLVWATPNGDDLLAYQARVSNPNAQVGEKSSRLIHYLLKSNHWSPFEMVNMCVEINTTRDIGRQILRHRSFSFQEFSQRYAEVSQFVDNREARLQDAKNRQNSIKTDNIDLLKWWDETQDKVKDIIDLYYTDAIELGIAKEVARTILPEGLTPTKMYMNGNARSWLTYFMTRIGHGTQKEHEDIAKELYLVFKQNFPETTRAYELTHTVGM